MLIALTVWRHNGKNAHPANADPVIAELTNRVRALACKPDSSKRPTAHACASETIDTHARMQTLQQKQKLAVVEVEEAVVSVLAVVTVMINLKPMQLPDQTLRHLTQNSQETLVLQSCLLV